MARALAEALGRAPEDIGVYGGGAHEVRPITIITYESAALHPELLRRFGLLIFDECHHLPAPTYRQIAEGAFTPLAAGPQRDARTRRRGASRPRTADRARGLSPRARRAFRRALPRQLRRAQLTVALSPRTPPAMRRRAPPIAAICASAASSSPRPPTSSARFSGPARAIPRRAPRCWPGARRARWR